MAQAREYKISSRPGFSTDGLNSAQMGLVVLSDGADSFFLLPCLFDTRFFGALVMPFSPDGGRPAPF